MLGFETTLLSLVSVNVMDKLMRIETFRKHRLMAKTIKANYPHEVHELEHVAEMLELIMVPQSFMHFS